jgi:hypothetical protein
MYILALIAGIAVAGGGSYAEARYVSRRWSEQTLPAFGYPNIHNWMGAQAVPVPMLLMRIATLVAGIYLIDAGVEHMWPTWRWVTAMILILVALLPVEVVRRWHNHRLRRAAVPRT